jgi:predicted small secreted protein
MNSSKKFRSCLFLLASLFALAATGCNTTEGFGKDLEKAGDKIQDKASR